MGAPPTRPLSGEILGPQCPFCRRWSCTSGAICTVYLQDKAPGSGCTCAPDAYRRVFVKPIGTSQIYFKGAQLGPQVAFLDCPPSLRCPTGERAGMQDDTSHRKANFTLSQALFLPKPVSPKRSVSARRRVCDLVLKGWVQCCFN